MEVALYLLPVTLGDTAIEKVEDNCQYKAFYSGRCALGTPFPKEGRCGYLY